MRWGRRLEFAQNRFQHTFDIFDDIIVPESNDAIPVLRELGATQGVGVFLLRMLTAVELDHKLLRRAGKVGDALADRVLAPELPLRATLA